jgi:cytochrome b
MNEATSPAPEPVVPARVRVRVWDIPVRITHWAFVVGLVFSWWTAETGRLEWHRWSGYTLLGLVLFRLYWGFFGSSTARFSQFVRGPRAIGQYLKGSLAPRAGHNPLGALSVVGLLVLLLAQIVLGLFAVDVDGMESGPLSLYVNFEAGRLAAQWHEWVFNALMIVVLLHVLAVLFYLFRRQNLVGAMITGTRSFDSPVEPVSSGSWIRLIIGIVLVTGLTWAVSKAFQL